MLAIGYQGRRLTIRTIYRSIIPFVILQLAVTPSLATRGACHEHFCLLPGIVEEPRMAGVIQARADATGVSYAEMEVEFLRNGSLCRMVSPDDVAGTIAVLISDLGNVETL